MKKKSLLHLFVVLALALLLGISSTQTAAAEEECTHDFDETTWGYCGEDGHAHKCKNCGEHDDLQPHKADGWQYDFQNKVRLQVCKCGYVMQSVNLKNFNVSFESNGGSGTMTPVSVIEGTEYTFPANGFTPPTDNVFTGWLLDGTTYKPGDKITPTGDLRLSAQWSPEGRHSHVYDSDYKANASDHWKECVCGAKDTPTAHDFGSWNTTTEPSTSAAGEKERYCNTCNYKETAEIEPLPNKPAGNLPSGGSSSSNSSSEKVTTTSPKTGDTANLFVWLTVLALSGTGISGILVYSGKRRRAQ